MKSLWTALHRRLFRLCQSSRYSYIQYRKHWLPIAFPTIGVYGTPYHSLEPLLVSLLYLNCKELTSTISHASHISIHELILFCLTCTTHNASTFTSHQETNTHKCKFCSNHHHETRTSSAHITTISSNSKSKCIQRNTLSQIRWHNRHKIHHSSWPCTINNSNYNCCNKETLYSSKRTLATAVRRPTFEEITAALSILGMSYSNAIDAKLLKSKYRELVKSNHPDTGGDAAKMAQITVAYERLANLTKYEWMSYHSQHSASVARGNLHHTNPYAAHYSTHSNQSHYAFYGDNTGSGTNGYYSMNHDHASHSQSSHNGSSSNSFYGNGYYGQSRAQQQQAYWNFYRQRASSNSFNGSTSSSSSSNDPFSKYNRGANGMYGGGSSWAWNNPLFSFNSRGKYQHTDPNQFNRANTMFQTGNILVQVFIAYLVISVVFLFCYRRYRDGNYEDGWKMAEKLARQEQIEELQRIRREMNERLRLHGGGWVPPEWNNRTMGYDHSEKPIPHEQLLRHVRQNTNYNKSNGDNHGESSSSNTNNQQSALQSNKTLPESNLPYSQRREQESKQNQLPSTQSSNLSSSTSQTSSHTISTNNNNKVEETMMKGWPAVDPSVGQVYQAELDPRGVVTFEPSSTQSEHAAMPNQTQNNVQPKNQFNKNNNKQSVNTYRNNTMSTMPDNISPARQSTEDEVMSTLREVLGKQQRLAEANKHIGISSN